MQIRLSLIINTHSHTHAEMESKMQKKQPWREQLLQKSHHRAFEQASRVVSSKDKLKLLSSPSGNTVEYSVWVTQPHDSVTKAILP